MQHPSIPKISGRGRQTAGRALPSLETSRSRAASLFNNKINEELLFNSQETILHLSKRVRKRKRKIYRRRRGWRWVEILEGVFFTPVISMISSSDPFIFTSSKLPNTHVCHRTISSERKYKYCNVRECTATGTCCSRCATKTIKNRGIQQHCVS